MFKKFLMVSISISALLMSKTSFAHPGEGHEGFDDSFAIMGALGMFHSDDHQGPKRPESCEKINLKPDQKKAVEDAFYEKAKKSIQLEADLKSARLDYIHNIRSDDGSADVSSKLAAQIKKSMSGLGDLREDFRETVYFKILSKDQRKQTVDCMMSFMHRHFREHEKEFKHKFNKMKPDQKEQKGSEQQ